MNASRCSYLNLTILTIPMLSISSLIGEKLDIFRAITQRQSKKRSPRAAMKCAPVGRAS